MITLRGCALAICLLSQSATLVRADGKPLAANVGVDEHVGAQLTAALTLTDQQGRTRTLSDFLQPGKPLLLALAYYHCPGLCDISLRELSVTLRNLGWQVDQDYTALTISIDPHDTPASAAAKRSNVVALMHVTEPSAWPFTVADAATLKQLSQQLGYRYDYDAKTHQYAHPAVSVVVTPEGKIARYLYGPTLEGRSVSLALREARLGNGAATALIDRTILACFQYDPATRRYGSLILGVMRGGAALIALALAIAVLMFVRRGRALRTSS